MPKTRASSLMSKVVGEEIRHTRIVLGLSQAEVARRLDVSAPYVANVEAGRHNLTIGQLATFASAMGVALEIRLPVIERDSVTLEQPL